MISVRLLRSERRLSYSTGLPRGFLPGIQGLIPFAGPRGTSRHRNCDLTAASLLPANAPRQSRRSGDVADLTGSPEETVRRIIATSGPLAPRGEDQVFGPLRRLEVAWADLWGRNFGLAGQSSDRLAMILIVWASA